MESEDIKEKGGEDGGVASAVPAAVSTPRKIPFVPNDKTYEFQAVVRLKHADDHQEGDVVLHMKQLRDDITNRFAVPEGYTPIISGLTFLSGNSSVVNADEARESLSVALKDIGGRGGHELKDHVALLLETCVYTMAPPHLDIRVSARSALSGVTERDGDVHAEVQSLDHWSFESHLWSLVFMPNAKPTNSEEKDYSTRTVQQADKELATAVHISGKFPDLFARTEAPGESVYVQHGGKEGLFTIAELICNAEMAAYDKPTKKGRNETELAELGGMVIPLSAIGATAENGLGFLHRIFPLTSRHRNDLVTKKALGYTVNAELVRKIEDAYAAACKDALLSDLHIKVLDRSSRSRLLASPPGDMLVRLAFECTVKFVKV